MTPLARREMKALAGASPPTRAVVRGEEASGGAPSGSRASSTRPSPEPWHCWYRRPVADVGCPRGRGRGWRTPAPAGGEKQWALAARRAPRTCVGNAPRSCGGGRGCQRRGSRRGRATPRRAPARRRPGDRARRCRGRR
eukprot:4406280-Pleurochrysis_carterae.AAC.2